jgi:UDP-N-acetylglucosamine acyltransferase
MSKSFIHPTSIVETKEIGEGTYIGPFCNISERVIIGKNCKLVGWSSIGNPGEFKVPPKDNGNPIIIGDGVEIREFVTINTPMGDVTKIGKCCYLMTKSHVGHDSVLEDNVVLSCGSLVGGCSYIGRCCYIGLNASTHQYAELGAYSIVGANSFFKGKSPMGITWAGVPARPIKINLKNIKKNTNSKKQQDIIEAAERFIKGI